MRSRASVRLPIFLLVVLGGMMVAVGFIVPDRKEAPELMPFVSVAEAPSSGFEKYFKKESFPPPLVEEIPSPKPVSNPMVYAETATCLEEVDRTLEEAHAALSREDWQGAISAYLHAPSLRQDHPMHGYHLGVAYQGACHLTEAASCFMAVLKKNPTHIWAFKGLLTVLSEMGNKEAVSFIETYYKRVEHTYMKSFLLGALYFYGGHLEQGVHLMEEGISQGIAQNKDIRLLGYILGHLYLESGKEEGGRELLARIKELLPLESVPYELSRATY